MKRVFVTASNSLLISAMRLIHIGVVTVAFISGQPGIARSTEALDRKGDAAEEEKTQEARRALFGEDRTNGLTLGPSWSWDRVRGADRVLMGVDVSYIFAKFCWVSLGARGAMEGARLVIPYGEIGVWFYLNAGVGYSAFLASGSNSHAITVFVGVPIPALNVSLVPDWLLFFEPYYRPGFRVGGAPLAAVHELGLLIKLAKIPFPPL